MTRCLIVGGHHDGEWVDADVARDWLQRPIQEPLSVYGPMEEVPRCVTVSIATYTRRRWRSGDTQWVIWSPLGMSDIDVMDKLLRGYSP